MVVHTSTGEGSVLVLRAGLSKVVYQTAPHSQCRGGGGMPSRIRGGKFAAGHFAEAPGFCVGYFAAHLKREISHTRPTAPELLWFCHDSAPEHGAGPRTDGCTEKKNRNGPSLHRLRGCMSPTNHLTRRMYHWITESTRMFLFGIKDGRVSCSHASWGCRFASNSIGIRANSYRIRNRAHWHPQPSCLPSSTVSLRPPCRPPSFLLNARERVPCAFRTCCPFVEYYNSLTWQKRRELGLMGYYYPMKDKLLDAMYSVFKGVCPLLPSPRAEHNVSCWLDGHPERASGTAVRRRHETWETILLQNETIAFPLHRHLLNTSTP